MKSRAVVSFLYSLVLGCQPEPPASSPGVELPVVDGPGGQSCGRGLAVLLTDYFSTNVAVLDPEGKTVSPSLVSSASQKMSLHAPLSGDVVFPTELTYPQLSLLDRYPTSVLTFLNIETGEVEQQVDVGSGFAANPQDYLILDEQRALVTRYEKNPRPGASQEDQGDDVLVLSRSSGKILSHLDLAALRSDSSEHLRPQRLLRWQDTILLTLAGYNARFTEAQDARVVLLDAVSLEVRGVHTLPGIKNCGDFALSPSGAELALVCSGLVDGSDSAAPSDSALLRFQLEEDESGKRGLLEVARILAADWALGPFSFTVDYAADNELLVGLYGTEEGEDAGRPDSVVRLRTDTGERHILVQSEARAFTLGQVSCLAACERCWVADAGRHALHLFRYPEQRWQEPELQVVDEDIGLPPRLIGKLP